MKKIVISFITLMAALLILIGFCSCGAKEKPVNLKENTTTWQDKNLKTDQNLYGVCKAYATASWAQNDIIWTLGFCM